MNSRLRTRLFVRSLEQRITPSFSEFLDPHPIVGNHFGEHVVFLSTGNVVITSPYDDFGGTDAGAVYLFNGATGAVINGIRGSHANDHIGVGGVTALTNGNYVIRSPHWDTGSAIDAGAVTFGNGITGISGTVSAANSLVGSSASDNVGYENIIDLGNGNCVAPSTSWDNGAVVNAGAITFINGATGVTGAVSPANSLIGGVVGDFLNAAVIKLSNGNYVVRSPYWDNGALINAGAATFGSGTTGVSGLISTANSLVGSATNDAVGSSVAVLANGNYVVVSPDWDNGSTDGAGAATFGKGTTGTVGVITAVNSLVGGQAQDHVGGNGVVALGNGNYVVQTQTWDRGVIFNAGASTFGNGLTGISGVVSTGNSLVGSVANDKIGSGTVTELTNGNYVLTNNYWWNGAVSGAGAVTFVIGSAGISGPISVINSLVGTSVNDLAGSGGVTALKNGNYVVNSPAWHNGGVGFAGAATFGNGITGISGPISATNSLVGGSHGDNVSGKGTTALSNGNYVVVSPFWVNGTYPDAGAVTFGNGMTGISGLVTSANSLVGSNQHDYVGTYGVTPLNNGNYVVKSPSWASVGAATFASGTIGISGPVSSANSLVGGKTGDGIGLGVRALTNGNYVVNSYHWSNGGMPYAGAITFANGTTGISGLVTAANSLVGSNSFSYVGEYGITALDNGNYVVASPNWGTAAKSQAGAVSFGNGTTGVTGPVSAANSLIGNYSGDAIGSNGIFKLSNDNYLIQSMFCTNGGLVNAGAVSFGNGIVGVTGSVSSANSVIGTTSNSSMNMLTVIDAVNGTFVGSFPNDGGGRIKTGSQQAGFLPGWLTVRNDNDSGPESLRQAILDANAIPGANTITFDAAAFAATDDVIALTTGEMAILDNLTIVGPGADNATISGNLLGRIFNINGPGTLSITLIGLTLTQGKVAGDGGAIWSNGENVTIQKCVLTQNTASGFGGAIDVEVGGVLNVIDSRIANNVANTGGGFVAYSGAVVLRSTIADNSATSFAGGFNALVSLTVDSCTITGNKALTQAGGGIALNSTFTSTAVIRNCTISGNSASTGGGGVNLFLFNGTLVMQNCTITNNSANGSGGGISRVLGSAAITLVSSIVSGNSCTNGPDIYTTGQVNATFSAIGSKSGITTTNADATTNGLFGSDLKLGPLANNGGPTLTHALLAGSPALNNGANPDAQTFDQRGSGYLRSVGPTDIGAFEAQLPPTVTAVVFGDGTNQRSLVKQIVVTFSESVNFPGLVADAFTLSRTGTGGTLGNVTLTAIPATGPASSVTITFTGSLTEFGSLVDGLYDFKASAGQISGLGGSLDGNNDTIPGGNYSVTGTTANKFFRYFGDSDGDGAVTQDPDFIAFRNSFGSPSTVFDFDNDGSVDQDDFIKFRNNFGGGP